MQLLSDQIADWMSRWNYQLICEAEVAHWLTTKETEVQRISKATSDAELPSSLDTASLKRLHDELKTKRQLIDELAGWRRSLLMPGAVDADSDVDVLRQQLDALVDKINRRIKLHKKVAKEAREAIQLKSEVQANLNEMVKLVSKVRGLREHCLLCCCWCHFTPSCLTGQSSKYI